MNRVTEELIRFGVTSWTHDTPDLDDPALEGYVIREEDNGQGFQRYIAKPVSELEEEKFKEEDLYDLTVIDEEFEKEDPYGLLAQDDQG